MGSKIQVWERGSERMAADSNVQVAQVDAAWLNEEPDMRNRKREGFVKGELRPKMHGRGHKDITNLLRPRALLSLAWTGAVLHGSV